MGNPESTQSGSGAQPNRRGNRCPLLEVESESPGEMLPAVGYAPPLLSLILDRRDGHLGFGPQSQRFSQVAHDVPGQLTLQARHTGAVLIVAAV